MSTHIYEYCPYCNNTITSHERSEFYSYNRFIGLKFERCPHCNKIYSTNKKLYCEMNDNERSKLKHKYYINIFSLSTTLYVILFLAILFISNTLFSINTSDILAFLFILPIIPSIILGYIISKKNFEKLKKYKYEDLIDDEELKNVNIYNSLNYKQEKNDMKILDSLINNLENESGE